MDEDFTANEAADLLYNRITEYEMPWEVLWAMCDYVKRSGLNLGEMIFHVDCEWDF